MDPEFCLALPDVTPADRFHAKTAVGHADGSLIFGAQRQHPIDKLLDVNAGAGKIAEGYL